MDARDIREFVNREREEPALLKLSHWVNVYARRGPQATFAAGQSLRAHALQLNAPLADEEARARDLEAHVKLTGLLDRAAHAFPGR